MYRLLLLPLSALVVLPWLAGCPLPDPAPPPLSIVLEEILVGMDDADDEQLQLWASQVTLRTLELVDSFEGDVMSESIAASLPRLDSGVAVPLSIEEGLDPADSHGVLTVRELPCTLERLEEIFLEPDQATLFPDNYEFYERFYREDPECWGTGECDFVSWDIDVRQNFGGLYRVDYQLYSAIRRSSDPEVGTFSRTYLPEPAVRSSDIGGYDQSYQAEFFLPTETGVLHVYSLWSDVWLAGQVEGEATDGFWANQLLNGIEDYDDRYGELCTL